MSAAGGAVGPKAIANGNSIASSKDAPAPVREEIIAKGGVGVFDSDDENLDKWLDTHYKTDEGIILSVVEERRGRVINWAYGPFLLKVTINFTSIVGELGIQIPCFGHKKLVDIHGDLITGVSANWNIRITKGVIHLNLHGRSLLVHLDAVAYGQPYHYKGVLAVYVQVLAIAFPLPRQY
ncbi:hypothetical protein BOTBODRAFT_177707 [Botryobasidium botryosum FD-172 SS1]|uniref:Uncharacterized protein n=1 Tax=Botryobasidium botryosum (strain FD-172 SS1) TaxID=930990 RepID=A0A067M5F8_BOTB1|nr:hypothetical protein BOTBODRAFT_177707 [Botryobasidium botryosum FD-172 SS1]